MGDVSAGERLAKPRPVLLTGSDYRYAVICSGWLIIIKTMQVFDGLSGFFTPERQP